MKSGITVTIVILVVCVGLLYFLDTNDSAAKQVNAAPEPMSVRTPDTGCHVTTFDNGVYYFACTKATFGRALSVFKKELNQRERIVSVAPDDAHGYGFTDGYFVVTETQ